MPLISGSLSPPSHIISLMILSLFLLLLYFLVMKLSAMLKLSKLNNDYYYCSIMYDRINSLLHLLLLFFASLLVLMYVISELCIISEQASWSERGKNNNNFKKCLLFNFYSIIFILSKCFVCLKKLVLGIWRGYYIRKRARRKLIK